MPRHLVYFVHADPAVRPRYAAALAQLGDVDLKIVVAGNFSSSYVQLAASLKDGAGRILPGLRAKHPPPRPVGEYATTSLITFSAGYALARALLGHEADRAELAAYVAIDSIHASFKADRSVDGALLQSFVEYARRAKAGTALFWIGHSDVKTPQPPHPKAFASTTQAATELARLAGGAGGNFFLRGYNVRSDDHAEHVAALTEWGPAFVAEALVPWLSTRGGVSRAEEVPPWQDPSIALGMRTVLFSRREMERGVQEEPLGSKTGARVREYFANCERKGKPLGLTAGDWCAAGACFAAARATLPGETLPHLYRASGIELQQDLAAAGAWRPLSTVLDGSFLPEPGDLCILKRGAEAWMRHVCRVYDVDLVAGTLTTIGANEGDRWMLTRRPLADPILGFGEYPALAARPAVVVAPDAELARTTENLRPEHYDAAVAEADVPVPAAPGAAAPRALLDAARRARAERYNGQVAGHLWRQADLGDALLRTARADSAPFAERVAEIQRSAGLGVDGKLGPDTHKVLAARAAVATRAGAEIGKVETLLSEVELGRILRDGHRLAVGQDPSDARLGCAWAQCALEHGRGKFVYCNNLGNISAFGAWSGSYYVIRVSERIKRNPDEWKVIAMKFRAHPDPVAGAADYWRLLTTRYAAAVALFDAGEADAAARKLSTLGYYTAHVDPYALAMTRLYREFGSKIRGRLPAATPAPVAAAPVEAPPELDDSYRGYLEGLMALNVDAMRGDVPDDPV